MLSGVAISCRWRGDRYFRRMTGRAAPCTDYACSAVVYCPSVLLFWSGVTSHLIPVFPSLTIFVALLKPRNKDRVSNEWRHTAA